MGGPVDREFQIKGINRQLRIHRKRSRKRSSPGRAEPSLGGITAMSVDKQHGDPRRCATTPQRPYGDHADRDCEPPSLAYPNERAHTRFPLLAFTRAARDRAQNASPTMEWRDYILRPPHFPVGNPVEGCGAPPPTAIDSLTIRCWAHFFKLKNSACPPTGVSGTRVAEIRSRFGVGCPKRMQMAENNTGPSLGAVWDGVTQRRVRAAGAYRGSKGKSGVNLDSH